MKDAAIEARAPAFHATRRWRRAATSGLGGCPWQPTHCTTAMCPLTAVLAIWPIGVPAATNLPPLHRTLSRRWHRPAGLARQSVDPHWDNPYEFGFPPDFLKTPPHSPDPVAAVCAARRCRRAGRPHRYLRSSPTSISASSPRTARAIQRFSLSNAIVYSLDPETQAYLAAPAVPADARPARR